MSDINDVVENIRQRLREGNRWSVNYAIGVVEGPSLEQFGERLPTDGMTITIEINGGAVAS